MGGWPHALYLIKWCVPSLSPGPGPRPGPGTDAHSDTKIYNNTAPDTVHGPGLGPSPARTVEASTVLTASTAFTVISTAPASSDKPAAWRHFEATANAVRSGSSAAMAALGRGVFEGLLVKCCRLSTLGSGNESSAHSVDLMMSDQI